MNFHLLPGFRAPKPAAPRTRTSRCVRCLETIAISIRDEDRAIAGETRRTREGELYILAPDGVLCAYCAVCSRDVRICRICGCTDELGCDDGCSWIATDLCSSCRVERAA